MKPKTILITLSTLFLLLFVVGCDDKDDSVGESTFPNAKIVKELHFASLREEGVIVGDGSRIINSKKELASYSTRKREILDTINFDKYSLILGTFVVSRLPVYVHCEFNKQEVFNSYKLVVHSTSYDHQPIAGHKYFMPFGIVVEKLEYFARVDLGWVATKLSMPKVLQGIWQPNGVGNSETGTITKIEKASCADCYKLELNDKGNFDLLFAGNKLKGLFKVVDTDFVFTDVRFVTDTNATGTTKQFFENLTKVKSYKITDSQKLLLYYSDTEYLIFEK